MNITIENNIQAYSLRHFDIETLVLESALLEGNPLNDNSTRYNLLLKPKKYDDQKKYKLLVVMSGFTSNSTKYFGHKPFELNYPQLFDQWCHDHQINDCIALFIDAFTFWGGSQFINSPLVGNYEDYIVKELIPATKKNYSLSDNSIDICLSGGSSGGYGALHIASKYPQLFGSVAAIAPDCDFELSLLPEIYHALPLIKKWGGIQKIKEELKQGKFFRRRESHTVINVIAMAYCYSSAQSGQPLFPIDEDLGLLIQSEWKYWLEKDPVNFLMQRKQKVSQLKNIYIEVGKYDQFNLQYGARKIHKLLKDLNVKHKYTEFEGNHFDISKQRPNIWSWFLKS